MKSLRIEPVLVGVQTRSVVSLGHPRDPGLVQLFGLGEGTAAGVNVTPDSARECPAVDACVGLNEDTLGTIPVDLYERTGADSRERAVGHPLHQLIHDAPNDEQSSADFRIMMEGWRETWGNAYARIEWRSDGIPRALWPMHPTTCRAYRMANGGVAYRWSPPGGGPQKILLPGEVLHLRDKPYELDLIRGQSRVLRHKESIGRALATGEYMSRFFSNNAVPKAFLKPAQKLDKDQTDMVREQFERRHGGLSNAFRVGVLPTSMDLIKLGIDNDSAQMAEAYVLAVQEIARIWGVPLHMIGEVRRGFDSQPVVITDGMPRKDYRLVKPFGRIEFARRANMSEAVLWALDELQKRSPVLTGRYAASHTVLINKVEVTGDIRAALMNARGSDRVQIVNPQPYARKIEGATASKRTGRGRRRALSGQARSGVYRVVQRAVLSRFGRTLFCDFGYVKLNTGVKVWGQRGGGSAARVRRDQVYPSLSFFIKQ